MNWILKFLLMKIKAKNELWLKKKKTRRQKSEKVYVGECDVKIIRKGKTPQKKT